MQKDEMLKELEELKSRISALEAKMNGNEEDSEEVESEASTGPSDTVKESKKAMLAQTLKKKLG